VTVRAEADFDHLSLEWLADRHRHNDALRRQSPVVWNRNYGFWYVTGYDEVAEVARDSETFTPRYEERASDGLSYIGIMGVPRDEGLPPVGIAEAEAGRHVALRRAINPFMLPAAVEKDRPFLEQAATWCLDQKIEEGRMDLVLDFTNPVPAIWTMKLMGLPPNTWRHWAEYFHAATAYGQQMPEYQAAIARTPAMVAEITEILGERRRHPGDDVVSRLATMEIEGRAMTDDELVAVIWNLLGGGVDTTTSLTSLALVHLSEQPQLRDRLAGNPALLEAACEEFLRWTSVNETLTRTCTRDTVLGGQKIQRGDFVMMSWLAADYDPAVFADPDAVDVDRSSNPHLAFGVGSHRCIGLHVARVMVEVMMRQVLTRLPDYVVDYDGTQYYQGNPKLYGVVTMPITFTPGQALGADRPF
jgi:cytochrome P450